jgi:hypothetical protein
MQPYAELMHGFHIIAYYCMAWTQWRPGARGDALGVSGKARVGAAPDTHGCDCELRLLIGTVSADIRLHRRNPLRFDSDPSYRAVSAIETVQELYGERIHLRRWSTRNVRHTYCKYDARANV